MGSSCLPRGRMTKCCKDKARCQEQLQKSLTGSDCFSLIVSPYSQNYLPDTFRHWFAIKITDWMDWWKHFFFPVQDFSCWTAAGEVGGEYAGTLDITHHHAWGTPSLVHPSEPLAQRDGGTHSRKRCCCIGAHFSEELFWSLRWRTPRALGQCVNKVQRRL